MLCEGCDTGDSYGERRRKRQQQKQLQYEISDESGYNCTTTTGYVVRTQPGVTEPRQADAPLTYSEAITLQPAGLADIQRN